MDIKYSGVDTFDNPGTKTLYNTCENDKKCYCYATSDAITEQFCAYEEDGYLIPCNPKCCSKKCSKNKLPQRIFDTNTFPLFPKILGIILAFLILLSILLYTL